MADDGSEREVEGVAGELVERLVAAVDDPEFWREYVWFLVFAVGGDALLKVEPDTGVVPPPGSNGARAREHARLVSRAEYMEAVAERLAELVDSGLREDVLVRAIRDEIGREITERADAMGANERREAVREKLLRWADDHELITRFREEHSPKDAEVAAMTDEQIAARLRDMAEGISTITMEAEVTGWATADRWHERAATFVSDTNLADWLSSYAMRAVSGGEQ